MNIIYDYQIFSMQQYGGISRYYNELARNINRSNDVTIISPLYINNYLNNNNDVSVKGIKINANKSLGYMSKIVFAFNRLINPIITLKYKPEIIHKTYYYDHLKYSKNKTKKVITVYDMINEIYPSKTKNYKTHLINKKRACDEADHIFCISENTRKDLIKIFDINPEKTTVTHLAFLSDFNLNKPKKIPNMRPFILFIGQRDRYKNFKNLLKAYASNQELNQYFDLVAFGGGKFTKSEINLITELGLSKSNVFHKGGGDSVLRDLYKSAALFVCPSEYEGFGITVLEAMNYGCPVVCSNTSSLPEVGGDAAYLFDPKSVRSISAAINKVIYDEELKKQLVKKGYERIKKFSWDKCAKITLDTYRKLI